MNGCQLLPFLSATLLHACRYRHIVYCVVRANICASASASASASVAALLFYYYYYLPHRDRFFFFGSDATDSYRSREFSFSFIQLGFRQPAVA